MHIAMVSEHASPLAALGGVDAGGQNVHVAALSSALSRLGHTVTVYTRRDDASLPERVDAAPGVEVVHIAAGPATSIPKDELLPYIPALGAGITRDLHRTRPRIVHAHFWMSGLAALDAARAVAPEGELPVVQTFHALGSVKRRHQGAADTSPAEREHLEPMVGRSVERVIATCSDEVFELRALGVPSSAISVAPCGVDAALFRPDGPVDRVRTGRTRIAVIGRLVPRKGIGTTITAMSRLKEAGRTDIELLVVGGSSDGADPAADADILRLSRLAREAGVADQVVFRGRVPQAELPPIVRSARAVVCAPWYEPFGIVPLEAMACGVPVIAASVGGLIDTVVDGVTGIHVPPRDPGPIADAIEYLVDHADEATTLGLAGRERAATRYTWDQVAGTTARIYRETLARTRSARPHRAGTAGR